MDSAVTCRVLSDVHYISVLQDDTLSQEYLCLQNLGKSYNNLCQLTSLAKEKKTLLSASVGLDITTQNGE